MTTRDLPFEGMKTSANTMIEETTSVRKES
jgi:hypothetical protein